MFTAITLQAKSYVWHIVVPNVCTQYSEFFLPATSF